MMPARIRAQIRTAEPTSFTRSINDQFGLPGSTFIDCSFADCTFAGTNFADTRFVDCKLVNCAFKHDNLGCDCDLSKTIVYGCSAEHTSGFPHNSNLAIPSV